MARITWTIAQAQRGEPIAARRSRNLISGAFLGSGALLAFLALLVIPGWEVTNRPVIMVIGILVAAGSLSQVVFASHVPIFMNHVASLVGTGTIAAAQLLAGYPIAIATVGLLYVWVAVFTSVFYSSKAAVIHVAIISAAQIAVLIYLQDSALIPQVTVTIGTCLTATFIVTWLIRDLREQVSIDPLTSLANRRGLSRAFGRQLAIARRTREPLGVAVLDLDGFKEINDQFGHAVGDQVLIDCARAWTAVLRPDDVLARTGGDEFTVLMPSCDATRAREIIARIHEATPRHMNCSTGVVIAAGTEDMANLMHHADIAMYEAKKSGGRTIVVVETVPTGAAA
jgi:diguanylate cyclase (GGDEF)-like protein